MINPWSMSLSMLNIVSNETQARVGARIELKYKLKFKVELQPKTLWKDTRLY